LACLEVGGLRISAGHDQGGVRMRAAWLPDAFGAAFVWGTGTRLNETRQDVPLLALSGLGTEVVAAQEGETRNLRVGLRGETLARLRADPFTAPLIEPWLRQRGMFRPRTCPRAEWQLQARILCAARLAERVAAGAANLEPLCRVAADEVEAQLLAVLGTAPHARVSDPDGGIARAQLVRRAKELLDAHPDETVSVAAVCRALGTTERTLQRAFRDNEGVGPRAYERHRRLKAVHGTILTQGNRRSITDIAMSFGFWHLGRFAGAYAATFGCSPSETRRRAWGEVSLAESG
jgi:AraC-like DNA-binding protein